MNFLSNLATNIREGVSRAASTVGRFIAEPFQRTVGSVLQKQVVNPGGFLAGVGSVIPAVTQQRREQITGLPPQSTQPGLPPRFGTGTISAPGAPIISTEPFTPTARPSTGGLIVQGPLTPAPQETGQSQTTPQPSSQSTPQATGGQTTPFGIDAFGRPLPAPQAQSGQTGAGPRLRLNIQGQRNQGAASGSTPAVSGRQGITGGSSSFTGTLSGVGGVQTGGTPTTGEAEEEQRRREGQPIPQGVEQPPVRTEPFSVSPRVSPEGIIELTNETIRRMESLNVPTETKEDFLANANAIINTQKRILDLQNPLPEVPVEDTEVQDIWLEMQPADDRFSLRTQMDALRENLGIPGLITKRADLANQALAIQQSIEQFAKQIKENPDFPVGLAQRRIESLNEQYGPMLQFLSGQQAIVEQQLDDANEQLDREFDIVVTEEQVRDRRQQQAQNNFFRLLEVGGTRGDEETIRQIAQSTGFTEDSIRNAIQVTNAERNKPETQIITSTDAAGNVTVSVINKNTGALIKQQGLGQVGKAAASSSGVGTGQNLFGTGTQAERDVLLRLQGVGISGDRLDHIANGIAQFGLEEVIAKENLNANQERTLREIYGQEVSSLTRENVSRLYGIPDNNDKTGFLGFGKTNKQKLDDIMDAVERRQAIGMSDEDILKEIRQ